MVELPRFRLLAILMACATLLLTKVLSAEQVPVRHKEGLMHGFLALRTLEGKSLADGEMTQIAEGNRVTSHVIFRFKDGSLYDDKAIFSQSGSFRRTEFLSAPAAQCRNGLCESLRYLPSS